VNCVKSEKSVFILLYSETKQTSNHIKMKTALLLLLVLPAILSSPLPQYADEALRQAHGMGLLEYGSQVQGIHSSIEVASFEGVPAHASVNLKGVLGKLDVPFEVAGELQGQIDSVGRGNGNGGGQY